jgi:iron(III) transport system substrate-binding protein
MKKVFLVFLIVCIVGGSVFAGGGRDAGRNRLVLYSSMTDNDLDNLLIGFGQKHPDIRIEIVNGSAGELTSRIRAESHNPQGDIMWGGLNMSDGPVHSEIFEHWLSPYEPQVYDRYRSNNGFYNFSHLSTIVFGVNPALERQLGITIRGYSCLLDPRLRGRIVSADPNSSSSAWSNIANIFAVFGHDSPEAWDYLERLAPQLVIVGSSSLVFRATADGEYVVGLTYEDGAATLLKAAAPNFRMVYPEEGASAFAFGASIIRNAPNMENAKKLLDFLMSAEGQTYMGNALGTLRFTNRYAQYVTPYLPPTEEIKWVNRDNNWLIENRTEILTRWNRIVAASR